MAPVRRIADEGMIPSLLGVPLDRYAYGRVSYFQCCDVFRPPHLFHSPKPLRAGRLHRSFNFLAGEYHATLSGLVINAHLSE